MWQIILIPGSSQIRAVYVKLSPSFTCTPYITRITHTEATLIVYVYDFFKNVVSAIFKFTHQDQIAIALYFPLFPLLQYIYIYISIYIFISHLASAECDTAQYDVIQPPVHGGEPICRVSAYGVNAASRRF